MSLELKHLRVWLALAALAVAAFAQTASEKPSTDVRRVGMHLKCKCGCGDSVSSCSMLECERSKTAKEKIARMQTVGMTDQQILDSFVREFGPDIYLSEPSAVGWAVPYALVGVGLLVILLFVRKYRKPKAMTDLGAIEIDDPALAKYKDQIERDLANLE